MMIEFICIDNSGLWNLFTYKYSIDMWFLGTYIDWSEVTMQEFKHGYYAPSENSYWGLLHWPF